MSTAIILLAGQSNAARISDELAASLDAQYGAGNYVLVEVYASGAPLTRSRDGFDDWATRGELPAALVQGAINALNTTPDGRIEGIIWVQGEADTFGSSVPEAYGHEFDTLFDGFRRAIVAEFGAGVTGVETAPVIISELSNQAPAAPERGGWDEVIAMQRGLAAGDAMVFSIDPDDVAATSRMGAGSMFSDGLHYSDAFSGRLADALVGALADAGGDGGAGSGSGGATGHGTAGNDRFLADGRATRMAGLVGDDIYYVDNAGDQIIENTGGGTDRVYASISFELRHHSQYLEDLTLTGRADLSGTGNGLDNTIIGNEGDNHLNGAWGDDRLYGGAGNDTLSDSRGADLMVGGTGNDVYHLDDPGDRIVEERGEGHDIVHSSVSVELRHHSQYLEDLVLTGSASLSGTGNGLANRITGNGGHNYLNGAWGDDTLIGGGGNDTMNDSDGADLMIGGRGDDVYYLDNHGDRIVEDQDEGHDTVFASISAELRHHSQYIEDLVLTGTANLSGTGNGSANVITGNDGDNLLNGAWGNDTLMGGAGDDTLQDSEGADRLIGGSGNDVYVIDDSRDRIVEYSGEGRDHVYASVSTELRHHSQYLENLTLTGSANIDGAGNGLDNVIRGNDGHNVLNGAWGNDTLIGGRGDDTLRDSRGNDLFYGEDGRDIFEFETGLGDDTIGDFDPGQWGEAIDLRAVASITGFADLQANHLSQSGANAVIDAGGGDTITLIGVDVSELSANDFLF